MTCNTRLQASSLANAIFICLMISILCGGLVLVSHYQNLLSDQLQMQEKLVRDNISANHYALSNFNDLPFDEALKINLFDDGVNSYITKKRWGFNEVLICKTVFKGDTVVSAKLIGRYDTKKIKALYLTDYDKPLRVSGKTKIVGEMDVPRGRIEQAYLNGQIGNQISILGRKLHSEDRLPKLLLKPEIPLEGDRQPLNSYALEELHTNPFTEDTKIIEIPYLLKKPVKLQFIGNFILSSKSAIEISAESVLKDVMIIAPKVTFKSGFKGNAHVVAKNGVILEDTVSLKYPSSIYIDNDVDAIDVSIGRSSSLLGSVILTGSTYNGSLRRKLKIDDQATLMGSAYCYGSTELKGAIIGSLYTDKFYLKTTSSEYENVIQNGTINSNDLPEDFISLSFSSFNDTKNEYAVIKEL